MPVCKMCGYTASSSQTVCRICGKTLEPTPLYEDAQTSAQPVASSPRAGSLIGRRALMVGVPTVVAAGVLGTFLFQKSIPTFEQIVPRNAVGVVDVDGAWWWTASAPIRAQPQIAKAMADAESEAGISLGQDVAPWVGEIGFSVLNADKSKPQLLACAQVRDWPAFFRTVARLKTKATEETGGKWTTSAYNGVQIERLEPKDAGSSPAVEMCWINGWVLVGVGDGTLPKAIDTVQGRSESLSQDATWKAALGHRPKNWFFWGGADWAQIGPAMKTAMSSLAPFMGDGAPDSKSLSSFNASLNRIDGMDGVTLAVGSDSGDGLRFDSINIPRTEKTRTMMRDLHGTSGGIDGDILKQLPRDSMMAAVGHDPNGWWHRYKTTIVSQMPAETQKSIAPVLKEAASLEPALANFKGDCGMAMTFDAKDGFGAVALAQAADPSKLDYGVGFLVGNLMANDVKVKRTGDSYSLPQITSKSIDPTMSASSLAQNFAPCFGAKGGYLRAASTPSLLSSNSAKGSLLTLPDAARNADSAMFGDFRLLPDIMKAMNASAAMPTVNKLGLSKAHWDMYVVSAPDGSLQQGTAEIQGWDWRGALKASLQMIP